MELAEASFPLLLLASFTAGRAAFADNVRRDLQAVGGASSSSPTAKSPRPSKSHAFGGITWPGDCLLVARFF